MAADAHAHGGHGGHRHSALQHQFDDMEQQRDSLSMGMWLFLATELMMFGGLFFAYSFYRWQSPWAFHEGASLLDQKLGTINTFVLLASSWTMAMAVHYSAERNKKMLALMLLITVLFGAAFLGIKAVEWGKDYQEGLVPGIRWNYYEHHAGPKKLQELAEHGVSPTNVKMYFTIYFCMTGLHAIHMIIGIALVGYFIFLALKGQFMGGNEQPVEILGLYWHLVDIIWIFLFPLLYLTAGFNPAHFFGGAGGH